MWSLSSRRLMNAHGEKRLYITDLYFDRDRLPSKLFLFLTDYGTEIELFLRRAKLVKRIRSKQADLYRTELDDGTIVLIRVDHLRGNHFLYCKSAAYEHIVQQYVVHDQQGQLSPTSHHAPNANLPADIHHKILLIDTDLIPDLYHQLEQLLKHNEVMLSPYYGEWLHAHVPDPLRAEAIRGEIERLAQAYSDRMIVDQYVDPDQIRNQHSVLLDDRGYLMVLAQQMNVTMSQVVILTRDSEWSVSIRAQGLQTMAPQQAAVAIEAAAPPVAAAATSPALPAGEAVQNTAPSDFPPRSQRHKPRARKLSIMSLFHMLF